MFAAKAFGRRCFDLIMIHNVQCRGELPASSVTDSCALSLSFRRYHIDAADITFRENSCEPLSRGSAISSFRLKCSLCTIMR
jgi:hypothetical protein